MDKDQNSPLNQPPESGEEPFWPGEIQYRELIEGLHEGVWLVNENGIIVYSNPQMAKMLRYEINDLVGRQVYDFMDEETSKAARRDYDKRRKGLAGLYERKYIKKNGESLHALVAASPLFDDEGNFKGSLAGILDITARKQIEERLAYQALVLENLHEAVIAADLDFRITSWNKAAEELYGWTASEAIGKHFTELVESKTTLDEGQTVSQLKKIGRASIELVQYNREGKQIVVLMETIPIQDLDGNKTGYIRSIRDITMRKKAEADLKMYAEKLERSNQELEEFAFIASHDLKEPLRKIKSFGDFLKDRAGSKLDSDEMDFLERIIQSAKKSQDMIEGLLVLALVSSAGKPFIEVDLNVILSEVIEELEVLIEERDARVEVVELPVVQADSFQMHQLFRNLVWNALKFVDAGKQPRVRVSEYRDEQKVAAGGSAYNAGRNFVQIAVEDNGIGFSKKEAKIIFLPFQRLRGRSKFEGSGIGLAVCRKIVERHGGSISIDSIPGEGSTFIVRLPIKK